MEEEDDYEDKSISAFFTKSTDILLKQKKENSNKI
jgi:hypothetical protein